MVKKEKKKKRQYMVLGMGVRDGRCGGMGASFSLLVPGGVIFFLELIEVDGDLVPE